MQFFAIQRPFHIISVQKLIAINIVSLSRSRHLRVLSSHVVMLRAATNVRQNNAEFINASYTIEKRGWETDLHVRLPNGRHFPSQL